MKIEVTGAKTIGQIQDEFHTAYPYLQLAFFSRAHPAYEGSPEQYRITDRELSVGHLSKVRHEGSVYIDPEMMVWQIERLFETEFGLHTQVMRRSRNQWLQTSQTDDLTLEDQNSRGYASVATHVEADPLPDYREQD